MRSKSLSIGIASLLLLVTIGCTQSPVSSQTPTNQAPANQQPVNNKLDLSNKGLTTIPMYVFDLTNLVELNVSYNKITGSIPSQIRQLKDLQVLNASNNQMGGVPAEIGQLNNLKTLDLSNNLLTGLPNELGNLTQLQTLNLSGNNYSKQDLDGIRAKLTNTNIIVN